MAAPLLESVGVNVSGGAMWHVVGDEPVVALCGAPIYGPTAGAEQEVECVVCAELELREIEDAWSDA